MSRKTIVIAALAVAAAAAVLLLVLPSRGPDFARLRGGRDFNVIVITVDTLRADRLGCYGFEDIETPAIDGFAARGVRFERCIATTPLTLPSHASLFTGTLPLRHGVRDNGGFVVPDELTTMAELFQARGYATGAFVGAYVLDSKWGLGQGFDAYHDRFDLGRFERVSLASVQRTAGEVMDAALPWIEAHRDEPFFAWIHLYDPHSPYEPPAPFDARYAGRPYLGEIAYTDTQLARLQGFLEERGLTDDLFLVFVADHGESLGEHNESTHGFFIYEEAVHVPLIVTTPFARFRGVVSDAVVSLADILPTVCDMAGLPIPAAVQGESLVPRFASPAGAARRLAYAETYYPRLHYGWSDLKSVQDGRFKLILAPVPELYDLAADPDESKNLVYLEKEAFARLSAEAEALIAAESRDAFTPDLGKVDEETRERLAALGYIGSFVDQSRLEGRRLADPKDKIGIFNDLSRARELGMAGRPAEGIRTIERILETDPDISDAWFSLGNIHYKERDFEAAVEAFRRAHELKPDDTFAVINVANAYQAMGRHDEAQQFVQDVIARGFEDAQLYFLLGNLNYRRNRIEEAEGFFRECLDRNPRSAASHNALAAIFITREDFPSAETHITTALEIDPRLTNARYNLAQVREGQGRLAEAEAAYRAELTDSPDHVRSLFNLARLHRQAGRVDEEHALLERSIEADPEFPLAYFYLARIHLNRGREYETAIALAEKGLSLEPDQSGAALGNFLLADLHNRLGRPAESETYARRGREAAAAAAAAKKRP